MRRKKKKKNSPILFFLAIVVAVCTYLFGELETGTPVSTSTEADLVLEFPSQRFPETAAHIQAAVENGHSSICTIDRKGADQNRDESLRGIPTKRGFDRDEWPMAMCAEGGRGADIAYISPSDNRGAGSWVSNQLEDYPDGTRVQFVVK